MIDIVLVNVLSAVRPIGLLPCVDVCQHTLRQEGKDRNHCLALESGMVVTMAKDNVACNALIDLFRPVCSPARSTTLDRPSSISA